MNRDSFIDDIKSDFNRYCKIKMHIYSIRIYIFQKILQISLFQSVQ